jgi:CheY-like chemotaxis protein
MSPTGRVLVVDDDESIRQTVEMALSGEGYEVRTASDGAQALSLVTDWAPQVILLDMKMPGTDGWAFAAEFRSLPEPHPPVVVLTAASDAPKWAAEIDADAVLPKPFDLDALLDMVATYTGEEQGATAPATPRGE